MGESMSTAWYYLGSTHDGRQPVGPLSWEQLCRLSAAGVLPPDGLVWTEGMPEWLPAKQIPGLVAPLPAAAYQRSQAAPASRGQSWVWPVLLPLIALLVAGATVLAVYFGTSGGEGGDAGVDATVTVTSTPVTALTSIGDPSVAMPGPFTLDGPVVGTLPPGVAPEFTWTEAGEAVSYTLEVATSTSFGSTDIINQPGITALSFTPSTPLPAGVVCYWRVTAVNDGGGTVAANGPFWCSTRFDTGSDGASGLAITPDGTRALVSGGNDTGAVAVVSLSDPLQVVATIPVGQQLGQIATTPDGGRALVVHDASKISVIDLTNNTVTRTIDGSVGTTLYGIAVTPDGATAVTPNLFLLHDLGIIDLSNYTTGWVDFPVHGDLVEELASPDVCTGIAVTPDGLKALVVTSSGGKLHIAGIEHLTSLAAVTTITDLGVANSVAVTPDGLTALVDCADRVARIDLINNVVIATIDFVTGDNGWHNIAITPDGSQAVVASGFEVAVISLADNTVQATYPAGGVPHSIAITPDGTRAVAANVDGTLSVVPLTAR